MPKEKPDDFSSWSERLEKKDGIPEINMTDKVAAWEKLSGRLKEQKRLMLQKELTQQKDPAPHRNPASQPEMPPQKGKTGKSEFWMAAACLLIVLIPAAILVKEAVKNNIGENKRKGGMAGRVGPEPGAGLDSPASLKSPVGLKSTPGLESPENRVMPSNTAYAKIASSERVNRAFPGSPAKTTDHVSSSKIRLAAIQEGDSSFLSAMAPDGRVDSGLCLAGQPVFAEKRKKELKVVHINEINDPAIAGPSLSGTPPSGGLRIKLGYHGRLTHPSVAASRSAPFLLKINTSPQNQ